MTFENPLHLPRIVWMASLVVTSVLVVIRIGLYCRVRNKTQTEADSLVVDALADPDIAKRRRQNFDKAWNEAFPGLKVPPAAL